MRGCPKMTEAMPAQAQAQDQAASDGHIVQASDIGRRFGEGDAAVDALTDISVDFERGRFTAIMGPSGSGKLTLLHILAGLDRPTSGTVFIDGTELTGLDDAELTRLRRDKLGFVFQFFNLLPVLTAEENLVLPLSIAGRKPDQVWLEQLIRLLFSSATKRLPEPSMATPNGVLSWLAFDPVEPT
jgi:putative ABC transport system ATP-binding protein